MEMSPYITALLGIGLLGSGTAAFAEKLIPIVPSYVLLLFIGTTVSDAPALLLTIAATVAGSVLGALCWYGLGRELGAERVESAVRRYGRYVFLSEALYRKLAQSYRRNHFWATVIGQIIPTVRIYLALPAGVLRLEFPPFLAATLLGTLAWNGPLVSIGYALSRHRGDPMALGEIITACFIAVELAIFFGIRWHRQRQHEIS